MPPKFGIAAWRLDAFPQLAEAAGRLQGVLRHSAATAAVGVNALFYGPPGTGKTELARALAEASGLRAYQVRSADEDGDGLRRTGRLSAYLLAQRLLGRRRDAVLIFDEVEDVFGAGEDLFVLLRGQRATGRQKGWMNRILEDNPVPAIWITNDAAGMDPAFLRRFLLPVAFVTPPRSVRRAIVESHLGDRDLPPDLLDELAADPVLAPAQLGAARRLLDLHPQAPAEQTVRAGVAAVRTLLYGAPTPRRRTPATGFDVAFLNLAGGISPSAIARALAEQGRGSLCFYGPPGTGQDRLCRGPGRGPGPRTGGASGVGPDLALCRGDRTEPGAVVSRVRSGALGPVARRGRQLPQRPAGGPARLGAYPGQ